jgi:maltose O-acetyltransferase
VARAAALTMATEREKMLAGEPYLASDPELSEARIRCRRLLRTWLAHDPADAAAGRDLLAALFGQVGEGSFVEPPFWCDYGTNIHVGARFYANFDCVVLDPARVDIGDDVMFGPGVHVYTASHPLDATLRAGGTESAHPIRIGSRCWIGGGARILPGVTIGDGTTVGAGSVVTRDLPPGVLAVGNPCRVVRELGGSGLP